MLPPYQRLRAGDQSIHCLADWLIIHLKLFFGNCSFEVIAETLLLHKGIPHFFIIPCIGTHIVILDTLHGNTGSVSHHADGHLPVINFIQTIATGKMVIQVSHRIGDLAEAQPLSLRKDIKGQTTDKVVPLHSPVGCNLTPKFLFHGIGKMNQYFVSPLPAKEIIYHFKPSDVPIHQTELHVRILIKQFTGKVIEACPIIYTGQLIHEFLFPFVFIFCSFHINPPPYTSCYLIRIYFLKKSHSSLLQISASGNLIFT